MSDRQIKPGIMKLVIATPFYEVKGYSPYIMALTETIKMLQMLGIEWDYYEVSGDSYVDRAKNSLVDRFMKSDGTHLFMIDSDMYWEMEGVAKMVKHALSGCPLIAAAYPCKNKWDFFGCIPKFDKETGIIKGMENNGNRALDMQCVPGGFIIYSRKVFEQTEPYLEKYHDHINDITYIQYFKCNIENNIRLGEDVYFQQRYKESGGLIWLEPNVTIKHIGVHAWSGNYQELLLSQIGAKEETPLTVPDYGDN